MIDFESFTDTCSAMKKSSDINPGGVILGLLICCVLWALVIAAYLALKS